MFTRLVALTALLVAVFPALADEAEDRAVEAIKKLGGEVVRDDKNPSKPVIEVDLLNTEVTDAGLKELASLKSLQVLHRVPVGSRRVAIAETLPGGKSCVGRRRR